MGSSTSPVTTYSNNISINYPATDTTYHAYNQASDTHTIDLGQTVYGGNLDTQSGVLTITHAIIDLGELSYTSVGSGNTLRFNASGIPNLKAVANNDTLANVLCEIYETKTWNTLNLSGNDDFVCVSNAGILAIRDTSYNDADVFKTAITGYKLTYELQTPVTVQLTPEEITAFIGTNNLWSDTNGDIQVTYISNDIPAIAVEYNNANSGLTATDTQNAIDEIVIKKTEVADALISDDKTWSSSKLYDLFLSLYPVITTSPAPIANFTTDLALPLKSCNIEIKPKQASGTPTPSNPLPISGTDTVIITQTGKNLFDKSDYQIVNGYIDTSSFNIGNTKAKTVYIPIKGGLTYTISKIQTARFSIATSQYIPSSGEIFSSRVSNNTATNLTITSAIDDSYLWIWLYLEDTDTVSFQSVIDSLQMEVGSTATTYEPYTATTKTVSLPQTVYGGEIDVTNGKLKDKSSSLVDLSSLSWQKTTVGGHDCFYAALSGAPKISSYFGLCTTYGISADTTMSADNTIKFYGSDSYNFARCLIRDDSLGSLTAEQFKSSVTGSIVYELVTPLEYDLTPEDLTAKAGVNNVFGDTDGNTSVQYRESVQKYIDESNT